MHKSLFLFFILVTSTILLAQEITHGPMLGQVTDNSIRVWARTAQPGSFLVEYRAVSDQQTVTENWNNSQTSQVVKTSLVDDNTGWLELQGLSPDTRYQYRLISGTGEEVPGGIFKTLPSATEYRNMEYNPDGLFNFSFQFGSCASQNPANGIGPSLPAYTTMLENIREDIAFSVMNGDWLYEENRDYSLEQWEGQQGIS